jgi:hypothetical protein
MDQYILELKNFIDGLGVRDVEFPEELTPQEVNLIVELMISAANSVAVNPADGLEQLLRLLFRRVREELGDQQGVELIRKVVDQAPE